MKSKIGKTRRDFHLRKILPILVLSAVPILSIKTIHASGTDWLWCYGTEIGGDRVFYSGTFSVEDYPSYKYDHAFFEYIKAHYDSSIVGGCRRAVSEQAQSRAKSDRDESAAFYRDLKRPIVFTDWTY